MRSIVRLVAAALFLSLLASPSWPDPASTGPPTVPAMLADALKALSPRALPQDTLIFSVGAESAGPAWRPPVLPPATTADNSLYGAAAPSLPDPATLDGILALYNRSYQPFGKVAAIAPVQMTVLNVDEHALSQIDPVDLSPGDAIKILLGSLTKTQWQELGSGGLAAGDLDAGQSMLFRAVVRPPLKIIPSTVSWNPMDGHGDFRQYRQSYEAQVQTLTSDMLAGARLEAHLATMYLLPVPDMTYQEWMDQSGSSGIAGVYQLSDIDSYQDNNSLSSLVRADLPNTLKPGNLNWNIRPLGATVALDGVKTVDDLVTRIGGATGLELYCDPHYASRPVLMIDNTGRPQKARDLLQALCVCVCGAWRQVGPAYVLTDDIEGLSGRRSLLKEMANIWTNQMRKLTDTANDKMIDQDWSKSLQFLPGDPNALSADQMKAIEDKAAGPNSGNDWLDLTYAQIPASAQTVLKDKMGQFATNGGDSDFSHVAGALGPGYKMSANLQVRVFLDVPSVGLVALDTGSYFTDVSLRKRGENRSEPPPSAPGKADQAASVPANTAGVLCAPRDAAQARAVVDKMASMGLRLLYCDVFTKGKAYVANPVIPPSSADAAAVLPAAIEEGKAKGVKVVAVVDTFAWGRADPKARLDSLPASVAEDETVTLEAASDALRQRAADLASPSSAGQPPQVVQWVSPADPAAQSALLQLVNAIARTPGLAGVAFEDTAPPSYLNKPNFYDPQSLSLGYTPAARLAFLRAHHADPIDFGDDDQNMSIWVGSGIGGAMVRLDIPSFDNFGQAADLQPAWEKTREQSDRDVMTRLFWAARGVSPSLPLFLRDPIDDFTISPWTNPLQGQSQARPSGFDPSRFTPGAQFVLQWSQIRDHMGLLSYMILQLNSMFAKAKIQPGLVFDLARDPSPDGPARDLDVISEHVHFTSTGEQPDQAKSAAH